MNDFSNAVYFGFIIYGSFILGLLMLILMTLEDIKKLLKGEDKNE